MGCADSKPEAPTNRQIKIVSQNKQNMLGNRQDLTLSDYEGFLKKSKEENRTDYPSAFSFIKIKPLSDQQISKMPKEDIPPLNCTRAQLVLLTVDIVMENSFAKSNINPQHLKLLVGEIADNYNSVSYHNFTHGFALMQMLYKCFKSDTGLAKIYSPEDLTYYLIAGITHDVNHRGTNNIYEEKMKTQLAKIAENDAILQKMHLRTFLEICKSKPEFDIISKSTNPQNTKQKITRAILATDMKKHFGNLKIIQDKRKEGKLDFKNEQIRIQFMENLVHACDIGNGLLPNEEYLTWGGLLTYEFNEQTKLEAANNVPVTQFLRYKGLVGFFDDQIGFLGTFVLPLWKEITVSFSGIGKMYANSQVNLASVKALKEKEKK